MPLHRSALSNRSDSSDLDLDGIGNGFAAGPLLGPVLSHPGPRDMVPHLLILSP